MSEAAAAGADGFEGLGLAPELVEALASEGIEVPTTLQATAIPVLLRGNNVVLAAGAGAGVLAAWAAPLLGRVTAGAGAPAVLVLTAAWEGADGRAESLARLGAIAGHRVAALGPGWVMPQRADVLVGALPDVRRALDTSELSLDAVQAVVVEDGGLMEALHGWGPVEEVLALLPADAQRVLVGLPLTAGMRELAERQARRAVVIPSDAAGGGASGAPQRGTVRFRVCGEAREDAVLATVAGALGDGSARHALLFCRSDDEAADMGDRLSLHGYLAGAPGDADVPVWLATDALAALRAAGEAEGVLPISVHPPTGPDELDRRHGRGRGGFVLVLPREMAHLRDVARRTGYRLEPDPLPRPPASALQALRTRLADAAQRDDLAPYEAVLEPLLERFDAVQLAAAALALLRERTPAAAAPPAAPRGDEAPAWVRLFLSVGEMDGLTPGDLVGAITGEAGIPGSAVGRIEIHERHSLVDVRDSEARKVMRALNGTTIRGRSVRADIDRGRGGGRGRGRPRRGPR